MDAECLAQRAAAFSRVLLYGRMNHFYFNAINEKQWEWGRRGDGFVLALGNACTQAYKCWETKTVIKGRCSDSLLITGKDLSDGLVSAPILHLLIRSPGLLVHSKREVRGCLRGEGAGITLWSCL